MDTAELLCVSSNLKKQRMVSRVLQVLRSYTDTQEQEKEHVPLYQIAFPA